MRRRTDVSPSECIQYFVSEFCSPIDVAKLRRALFCIHSRSRVLFQSRLAGKKPSEGCSARHRQIPGSKALLRSHVLVVVDPPHRNVPP